jgi:beta-galactosidase/beta-glucuronidase
MARLNEYREGLKDTNVANLVLLPWLEKRYWEVWPTAELEGREVITQLPMEWKLRWDPEEVGREQGWYGPDLDATDWLDVRVDSAWEKQAVGEAWAAGHGGDDYDGLAWYRTAFEVPADLEDRKVHLLFGAVDEGATVWVNGDLVGEHPFVNPDDWTTPFAMEFTDVAKFGATNTVVVEVEDRSGAGGVWKPVLLIAE